MKRLRDDDYDNSQIKRPFGSSRGESYGQPHPRGGAGGGGGEGGGGGAAGGSGGDIQKLTTNDALTYLKEVKEMFQDQREKYDMFLDVMKDFKAQRIDTTGVIMRVKELFQGHNNLIYGFNTFLPKGYEITVIDEGEAPSRRTVEFEEAISFVNRIKKRFQNDDRVYKSFLDTLNMYRKEQKGITEVYREVAVLFEGHQDLLEEFTRFLPDVSATASAPHTSFGRHSLHRCDERSSAVPMRQRQMDKQRLRRDRIISPHDERDLSVQCPDLDGEKKMMKMNKEQRKHSERENRDKMTSNQDFRELEQEDNLDSNVHRVPDKKKSAQTVEDFGGSSGMASYDDKDALKRMYSQEFAFCEKVKERLRSPDDYQAFLKCLHIYSTEIITRKELQNLVADLLGKYPDLMKEFNKFLECCERIDGFLSGVISKKSLWNEGHGSKSMKMEDKENEQKREMDGIKEKDRLKEKYWGKSIQDLDLSNCQRCTPSYRLLPEDYPIPSASHKSELGAEVLNDHWVSVTSGSEDYSFKHMHRNQYEESLFRCEDDRFELDMLLESATSTAKCVEELMNNINDNSISIDGPIHLEDYFTALNLRFIERLYGDHGLEVVDLLRKRPSLTSPVILARLKQKQEEWTKSRSQFNKFWAEIYAKNHDKSLDQRSFFFKQQDSKDMNVKSLVAEIKEVKEKKQNENDVLLSIAAGSRHPIVPTLEFEYYDTEIHEDIYKLVLYSCEEVCTSKEQLNKVMRLWTTFLEPMLGIPSRSHGSEGTGMSSFHSLGTMRSSGGKSHGSPGATTMNVTQLRPVCNGDVVTSPVWVNSCGTSLADVNSMAKEDNLQPDNEQKITANMDMSGFNGAVASNERPINSDTALAMEDTLNSRIIAEVTPGHGASCSRLSNTATGNGHGARSIVKDLQPSSEGGDMFRSGPMSNGGCAGDTKVNRYNEVTIGASKLEKEVGESSVNGDFVKDSFIVFGDGALQAMANTNSISVSMQFQAGNGKQKNIQDSGVENDAIANDGDSENVSEADEDVSGSESAVDECSREEHEVGEDGERDELDGKTESDGEVEGIANGHFIEDSTSLPLSGYVLSTAKPLAKHLTSAMHDNENKGSRIFYGNDTFYVLFRLHQILYERLLSAKLNSASAEMKWTSTNDACPPDIYARFMSALHNLLNGSIDNSKFEDDCRALIGNQSYILFTLDKLIYKLVKQLQIVASDEIDSKLLQLYKYEKSRKHEKFVDSVYYENVHVLLHDEDIYRFECLSCPSHLSIQLMDEGFVDSEELEVSIDPRFAGYIQNDFLSVVPSKKDLSNIMLRRNKRKYANLDESSALCMAMEGVHMVNGLEYKMACNSFKILFVLDTEDFFIRARRNASKARYTRSYQERVKKFHKFLSASK